MTEVSTGKWYVEKPSVDPYNPLNLPPGVVRVRTYDRQPPQYWSGDTTYETATRVQGTLDVYDVYKSGTSLSSLMPHADNVVEVLGANTTGITDMSGMFAFCQNISTVAMFDTSSVTNMNNMFAYNGRLVSIPLFDTSSVTSMGGMFERCTLLTTVPLFDTSRVTNMGSMFYNCISLTSVPLFDTSNVINMENMFYECLSLTAIPLFNVSSVLVTAHMCMNCLNVASGALAIYQQASARITYPEFYLGTFYQCGINTTTGRAELEQIPADWK